jgi:hypothetical protein
MPNNHVLQRLAGLQTILNGVRQSNATLSASSKGTERAALSTISSRKYCRQSIDLALEMRLTCPGNAVANWTWSLNIHLRRHCPV